MRLFNDLEEICYQGKHMTIVYLVSLPGMILWAFGVPLLALFLIMRQRRELEANEYHSDRSIYLKL